MVGCEQRGGPVSLWGMLALWHPSTPFAADYPDWQPRYGIDEILQEMYEQNVERWMATAG